MDHFKTFSLFYSILTCSTVNSQNSITTQAIPINNSELPVSLAMVNDDLAWIQEVNDTNEIFVFQDGNVSMINTPGNFMPDQFSLTETYIAWPPLNLNGVPGICNLRPFGFYYLDGSLQIDNHGCLDYISNNTNLLRVYFNFDTSVRNADIVGPDFNVIASLPSTYQGSQINYSGIASYWGDHVFIKGIISAREIIFYYNVKTGVFNKVFQSLNYLSFPQYKNSETLIFTLIDDNNEEQLYFYDGQTTNLVQSDTNILNGEFVTFRDRIVWATTDRELIEYHNGILDTLLHSEYASNSLNTSDCYLTWGTTRLVNNTSTLSLDDGNNIQTVTLNGVRVSPWRTQLSNDGFAFVLDDLSDNSFNIIKGDFENSCCTDEDITTDLNDDEFSHTFIESTTAFTCNTSPVYQALDYIELNEGFSVPSGHTFCALIEDQCILFQD